MVREARPPLVVRPIRPEDRAGLQDLLARLSEESRYQRFFSPKQQLSAGELAYLTQVDHDDHEALVALEPAGAVVGVARYIRYPREPQAAEVAVAVHDDWQHRGVGEGLLRRLTACARARGVKRFQGLTLAGNARVLALAARLGETRIVTAGDGTLRLEVVLERSSVPSS